MIFLTGMMGSGKTTAGRVLAKKLGWRFADTDRMVERAEGMAVAKIFQGRGEAYFRKAESKALKSLLKKKRLVVATGGGMVLKASNRSFMKRHGAVVFLELEPAAIARRLGKAGRSARPLLAGGIKALAQIEKKRRPLYRKAGIRVPAKASPSRVAALILLKIKEKAPLVLHDKTAR